MTFRLCTAPPSVLLGYEVCKWRVICFIHSGADRLHGDVCSRTISTVESTARPNIQDRKPIDQFSWVILAPVSGFINRGDVRAHTPYGSLHKLSMACDCGIGAVNTAQTTPCSYSMTSQAGCIEISMFLLSSSINCSTVQSCKDLKKQNNGKQPLLWSPLFYAHCCVMPPAMRNTGTHGQLLPRMNSERARPEGTGCLLMCDSN